MTDVKFIHSHMLTNFEHAQKFWAHLRIPAYANVLLTYTMYNLLLTYVSVCKHMSKNVHMLAYAGPIRCSVTGPLEIFQLWK